MTARRWFWLACALVALAAAVKGAEMNPDQKKIRRAIDKFVTAYNAADVDRLVTVYAADFIDMSEAEPTLRGAEARQDTVVRLRDTFAKFTGQLTVEVDEIETMGDWAFDRGTIRIELRSRTGGPPVLVERRFLEIWRRETDGVWRVTRAMDNSARGQSRHSLDFRR
jgi:ketosteroid isomerase-like protein